MLCMMSSKSLAQSTCVKRIGNCSNMSSNRTSNETQLCCYKWSREIKNHKGCVCDNFTPSSLSLLSDFFDKCGINPNPLILCGEGIILFISFLQGKININNLIFYFSAINKFIFELFFNNLIFTFYLLSAYIESSCLFLISGSKRKKPSKTLVAINTIIFLLFLLLIF